RLPRQVRGGHLPPLEEVAPMRIDVLAGEPHFVDHLAPVWLALPESARGDFIVQKGPYSRFDQSALVARAKARGIEAPVSQPTDPTRPVLVTSRGDHKAARA